jgi:hypothetical protein
MWVREAFQSQERGKRLGFVCTDPADRPSDRVTENACSIFRRESDFRISWVAFQITVKTDLASHRDNVSQDLRFLGIQCSVVTGVEERDLGFGLGIGLASSEAMACGKLVLSSATRTTSWISD